jgi:hypothetical protein
MSVLELRKGLIKSSLHTPSVSRPGKRAVLGPFWVDLTQIWPKIAISDKKCHFSTNFLAFHQTFYKFWQIKRTFPSPSWADFFLLFSFFFVISSELSLIFLNLQLLGNKLINFRENPPPCPTQREAELEE